MKFGNILPSLRRLPKLTKRCFKQDYRIDILVKEMILKIDKIGFKRARKRQKKVSRKGAKSQGAQSKKELTQRLQEKQRTQKILVGFKQIFWWVKNRKNPRWNVWLIIIGVACGELFYEPAGQDLWANGKSWRRFRIGIEVGRMGKKALPSQSQLSIK